MMTPEMQAMIDQAAAMEDQSVSTQGGGGSREFPLPGTHFLRFVEYVEQGKHTSTGKYGTKTQEKVRLGFELVGKKAFREVTVNGETKQVGFPISIPVNKSSSSKGDFQKIFHALDAGRGKKHFAQMLGEPFMAQVTAVDADGNVVSGDDPDYQKKVKYLNLFSGALDSKAWTFRAPVQEDPETGETKRYNVPPATLDLRMFLWNVPTIESWQSLYIDGTREVKDEKGNVKQVSKNFIQERCMEADNWQGSPMHLLLAKNGMLEEQQKNIPTTAEEAFGADLPDLSGVPAGMDDVPF